MARGIVGDAYESRRSIDRITQRKQQMQLARTQAVSGLKVSKLRDLGGNIVFVQALQNDIGLQQKFIDQNKTIVKLRLGEKERVIRSLQSVAEKFKEDLVSFNDGTAKDPAAMIQIVQQHMIVVEREGNTKVGDSYVFGGTITNLPPFNLSQIPDGIPANSSENTDYYNGNHVNRTIAVDINNDQSLDLLGTHPSFEKLVRALKITADLSIKSGDTRVTRAQNLVDEAIDELAELVSIVGAEEEGIDQLIEAQENKVAYFSEKYSELTSVDELEVTNRFVNDQRILNLAYEMLRSLNEMSLSNYLRN
jgi:flagellar hook-associated protein 3 FlgL